MFITFYFRDSTESEAVFFGVEFSESQSDFSLEFSRFQVGYEWEAWQNNP